MIMPDNSEVIIERTLAADVRQHLVQELDATNKRISRLEAEVRALRAGRQLADPVLFPPSRRTRP